MEVPAHADYREYFGCRTSSEHSFVSTYVRHRNGLAVAPQRAGDEDLLLAYIVRYK
jgi:hypothetical protein